MKESLNIELYYEIKINLLSLIWKCKIYIKKSGKKHLDVCMKMICFNCYCPLLIVFGVCSKVWDYRPLGPVRQNFWFCRRVETINVVPCFGILRCKNYFLPYLVFRARFKMATGEPIRRYLTFSVVFRRYFFMLA